ncbi:hypothetical protein SY87_16530 [Burkholderia pseudomallei]|nr:hypothetical protein SY87_16530 [Burkholderia pseudomallei]
MFRGALKYRMRAEVDRGACGGAARRRFLCGLGLGLGLGAGAGAGAGAGPQSGFAAARLRLRFSIHRRARFARHARRANEFRRGPVRIRLMRDWARGRLDGAGEADVRLGG